VAPAGQLVRGLRSDDSSADRCALDAVFPVVWGSWMVGWSTVRVVRLLATGMWVRPA
jgi:hypothetical protein